MFTNIQQHSNWFILHLNVSMHLLVLESEAVSIGGRPGFGRSSTLQRVVHYIIKVLLELNLLGEKGEEKKTATAGLKPRVSDCSRHNH